MAFLSVPYPDIDTTVGSYAFCFAALPVAQVVYDLPDVPWHDADRERPLKERRYVPSLILFWIAMVTLRDGDVVTVVRHGIPPPSRPSRLLAETLANPRTWGPAEHFFEIGLLPSTCVMCGGKRYCVAPHHHTDQTLIQHTVQSLRLDVHRIATCTFRTDEFDVRGHNCRWTVAVADVPAIADSEASRSRQDFFVLCDLRPLGLKPVFLHTHAPKIHVPSFLSDFGIELPPAVQLCIQGGKFRQDYMSFNESCILLFFTVEADPSLRDDSSSEAGAGHESYEPSSASPPLDLSVDDEGLADLLVVTADPGVAAGLIDPTESQTDAAPAWDAGDEVGAWRRRMFAQDLAQHLQVPMPWRARSFRCVVMWGASLIHDALAESHWPFTPVTVLRSSWSSYRTETSCLRDLVVFLLPPWLVQWCLAVLVIGEARLSSACALVPEPAEPRIYGQEPDAVTDGKRALNLPLVDFTMLDVVFVLYVFEEVDVLVPAHATPLTPGEEAVLAMGDCVCFTPVDCRNTSALDAWEGRDSKSEPSTAAAVPFPKLFPHGRHCCPATVNAARAYDGQTTSGGSEPFGAFGFAGLCLIFSVLAALGVDPPSLGCARLAYLGIFAVPSWSHYSYSRHAASGCPCAGLSLG
ncbi:hypothetical protein AK812_SmicGene32239 [Symbiodinium microadriaticum]|uniref:Uncharacterized protein n=1 Tax=Symbiodinium microadriaticum TaxID=2951 RepID=A0A1Q9CUN6_SYMMI|nr:hypothetical protein AK812_SmicGene32239 [Symbiodinium microadriaticum]CAE6923148.1 unnamed protein product [Symbiodinium sp. KB8]CAE7216204.1 unnamed protein product [Symbiodinium microadriaticum]